KSAKCRAAAAATEKRLEEVAESGPTELKLHATAVAAPLIVSTFSRLRAPLWRRLETAGLIPIRAELIVLFPFLWIAQDLVRFVDLLEFLFGGLLVLGDVRVMLARQLAKSAANLVFG